MRSVPLVDAVDHVGLTVPDLAAALTMWCDHLGFTLERSFDLDESITAGTTGVRSSTIHTATVVLGDHRIELLEYRPPAGDAARIDPSQNGATHIALSVHDIDAVLAVCRTHGWTAVGAPHRLDTGARAGSEIIYLHGPAGGTLGTHRPAPQHRRSEIVLAYRPQAPWEDRTS